MSEEFSDTLSSAQRSKIRRLSQPQHVDESEEAGELNIVPFLDIITNILIFVLATIPAVFTVTIATEPPSLGGGKTRTRSTKPSLNLSVWIVDSGVSVKASGGNVAPGCSGGGQGITVPKKNNDYDWVTLKECVTKLKNSSNDFAEENTVQISASPGIDYQNIIRAIDAVRQTDDGKELFPQVNFGVIR
jgi:biopolymer transport protein TolR